MSDISDFGSYASRIQRGFDTLIDRVKDVAKEEFDKENKLAYKEFGEIQKEIIERIYRESVDTFYESYDPERYRRTKSLYNVLDIKLDADTGMVISDDPTYEDLYDESKMVTGRGGQSLYQTVFVQGYHGGAASISGAKADVWGTHPSTGTPYYRRGGWVKYPGTTGRKFHRYGKWGRQAVKTKSIYQMMIEDLGSAEAGEIFSEFKQCMDGHADIAAKRVNERIIDLQREIFG